MNAFQKHNGLPVGNGTPQHQFAPGRGPPQQQQMAGGRGGRGGRFNSGGRTPGVRGGRGMLSGASST